MKYTIKDVNTEVCLSTQSVKTTFSVFIYSLFIYLFIYCKKFRRNRSMV
jgi:hypothetical protein